MTDRIAAPRVHGAPGEGAESLPRSAGFTGSRERWKMALAVAAIGVGVFVQFWPILRSDFQLEDFVHLYDLANYGLAKLLLAAHGGHSKITSNLVYVGLEGLFGLDPPLWFVAALALHVLNAALLLGFLRRVGCLFSVAFPLVLAWALLPLHMEILSWIGTIGQALIATFALLLLRSMVDVGHAATSISVARSMAWWLLGLAAATSFSMGIAVAGTLWFAAAALLAGVRGRGRTVAILATLVPLFPIFYVIQHTLHAHLYAVAAFHEPPLANFAIRPALVAALHAFRPTAELLAYAVVVLPSGIIRAPNGTFANAGPWKDLPIATFLFWASIVALVTLAALPWALWKRPRPVRWLAAVLAVFAVATYGTIAWGNELRLLAGPPPALPPNIVLPPIASEALVYRYHYVGTLFVVALLALACDGIAARGRGLQRAVQLALLLVATGAVLRIPAAHREAAVGVAFARFLHPRAAVLKSLHAAAESASPGDIVHLPNKPLGGGLVGLKAPNFPGWAAFCVVFVSPDCMIDGRQIRFVEQNAALLDAVRAQTGTPISRLVVPSS